MHNHTLQLLEFNNIKESISQRAITAAGKDAAQQLPFLSQTECEESFDQIEALQHFTSQEGSVPLQSIAAITPKLKMLAPENAYLSCQQTRACAEWLLFTEELARYFKHGSESTPLAALKPLVDKIKTWPKIKSDIFSAINEQGEMNDNASPSLKKIRKDINKNSQLISATLKRFLHDSKTESYFQEKIVTIRNDRFVIPLKSNHNGKIKGIIQDRSSSGETIFLEPETVVPLNNQLKQLLFDEEKEVIAILKQFATQLRNSSHEIEQSELIIIAIDIINAKCRFAEKWECSRPKFSKQIILHAARHPLLHTEPVPVDIKLQNSDAMLVITGPNTGGKTVTLKTIGLFSLMARCGLFIPAAPQSELRFFSNIYCDIGDEQSIEQNLSTFSAHIKNINSIIESCDKHSLILLDELGAGTDPIEGSALGIAVIKALLAKKTTAVITTHYSAIKDYAFTTPDICTAGVEFDMATLQPTYKLLFGIPSSSRALDIAQRLGMPQAIVDTARSIVNKTLTPEVKKIGKIEKELAGARKKKKLAEEEFSLKKQLAEEYEQKLQKINQEKEKILAQARLEAKSKFKKAEETIKQLIKELRASNNNITAREESRIKTTLKEVMSDSLTAPSESNTAEPTLPKKENSPLAEGDTVHVPSLDKEGIVIECNSTKQIATLTIGAMQIKLPFTDLVKIRSASKKSLKKTMRMAHTKAVYPTLDIRGERYEDAVDKITHYLDDAALAGLQQVTIIHGKGTGSLRQATDEVLKNHPSVKKHRLAVPEAGGYGATEVKLKQ